jgi:hypothetical protein
MGAVRGRFPIPRSRRGLLIAAAALVVVLAGAAVGIALAATSGNGDKHPAANLATASFPGFELAFDYPSAWHRKDWCWVSAEESPITLLTTAAPTRCEQGNIFGFQTPFPPPLLIRPDGVAAWWSATSRRSAVVANAQVGGRPARISVASEATRRTASSYVNCTRSGATQRRLTAVIEGHSASVRTIRVEAVICGPDFRAGQAAVRAMLASLRFTS